MVVVPAYVQELLKHHDVACIGLAETVVQLAVRLPGNAGDTLVDAVEYTPLSFDDWWARYIDSGQHLVDWHRLVAQHTAILHDLMDESDAW